MTVVIVLILTPLRAQISDHPVQLLTINGSLMDADCKADDPHNACPVTPVSTGFGIQTHDGKFLKLVDHGNARVQVELRRLRKKIGDIDRARAIMASVTGSVDAQMIKVDAVELYQ